MKLTMNRIIKGEDEVIIRYQDMTEQIEAIARMVQGTESRISAFAEGKRVLLLPENILYVESVDGVTYAYLEEKVLRVQMSLTEAEMRYGNRGFFRCSKSMVLNIYKISYLKSEPGNRIRAAMENGEQVMISRRYAKELRRVLKGGGEEDEE